MMRVFRTYHSRLVVVGSSLLLLRLRLGLNSAKFGLFHPSESVLEVPNALP